MRDQHAAHYEVSAIDLCAMMNVLSRVRAGIMDDAACYFQTGLGAVLDKDVSVEA